MFPITTTNVYKIFLDLKNSGTSSSLALSRLLECMHLRAIFLWTIMKEPRPWNFLLNIAPFLLKFFHFLMTHTLISHSIHSTSSCIRQIYITQICPIYLSTYILSVKFSWLMIKLIECPRIWHMQRFKYGFWIEPTQERLQGSAKPHTFIQCRHGTRWQFRVTLQLIGEFCVVHKADSQNGDTSWVLSLLDLPPYR